MDIIATAKAAHLGLKGIDALTRWLDERRKRRLREWQQAIFRHPCWGAEPDVVQEEIRRAIEDDADESRRELIWATAKELVDSVSDAALPAIASLTAERLQGRRPMDASYRGAVRLLADLSSEEVTNLSDLLTRVARLDLPDGTAFRIVLSPPNKLTVRGSVEGEDSLHELLCVALPYNPIRLVTLLKDNHLGYELIGVWGAAVVVDIERHIVAELLHHLVP